MKKERLFKRFVLVSAAVFVAVLCSLPAGANEGRHDKCKCPCPSPTLYERLGGLVPIAVLIDDVIDRSYANEVFKANPRIEEAHRRYPKAAYKYNATALACMIMGGPQKYAGRSLKDAHQHLQVNEIEWQELKKIFRDSMDSFKVPENEQNEILGIIESTKGDVVVTAEKSAKK
jgi:hemoglobin